MYEKIAPEKQRSQVVEAQIKVLIRSEKLKPGEKLPNEMELSALFSVSRPTVREAVKSLISQNIVEIQRGKGTFVSKNPGLVDDPLGLDFVLNPNLRLCLIEARLVIEPGVARLATLNADEDDLRRIEGVVHEMEEIVRRNQVGMNIELDFHRSIAQATKNPVILRLVPVIVDSIVKTYRDAPRTSEDHRHALEEHIEIYEAIKSGNPETAYKAMERHLEKSYHRTLSKQAAKAPTG
ncbi:MAG: FadR/GntR family transcriptional regulator [Treponemataceae bacterium]